MRSEPSGDKTSNPVARLLGWTLGVGAVSFAAGFFGPIIFSKSNLGPLLGIFVTGPVGFLAGAVIGALYIARGSARLSIAVVGLTWVLTLLYTLFIAGLAVQGAVPPIGLQILIVAASMFLFIRHSTRNQLPTGLKRSGPIAIAALLTVLLMTLFPPVIAPWWVPADKQPAIAAPLPSFAFILDGRFDAGRHFPQFAVSRAALAREWLVTAAAAIGLCVSMLALSPRPRH